jgi:hypothetical protein
MRNSRFSPLRYVGIVALVSLLSVSKGSLATTACYSTPRMAVDSADPSSSSSLVTKDGGYRVTKIKLDPVLGRRWALIARCSHPNWPIFALPANGVGSIAAPRELARSLGEDIKTTPIVRAGDIVRLWRQEHLLRIEVAGVSEESGGLGKTVRVRLLRRNTDDQSMPAQFSGIVRGPSDVEMQP